MWHFQDKVSDTDSAQFPKLQDTLLQRENQTSNKAGAYISFQVECICLPYEITVCCIVQM